MYTCPFCGKTVRLLRSLKGHITRIHPDKASATRCPVCGREFKNYTAITRHCFFKALKNDDHAVWYYLAYKRRANTRLTRKIVKRAIKRLQERKGALSLKY